MVLAQAHDQGRPDQNGGWSARRLFSRSRTRILLALPCLLHRDLVRTLFADEPDLEVIGEAVDPADVLIATGRTQAHVVLFAWPPSGRLPGICSLLLNAYPNLLVIGIRTDGSGHLAVRRNRIARMQGPTSLAGVLAAIREGVSEAPGCTVNSRRQTLFPW